MGHAASCLPTLQLGQAQGSYEHSPDRPRFLLRARDSWSRASQPNAPGNLLDPVVGVQILTLKFSPTSLSRAQLMWQEL